MKKDVKIYVSCHKECYVPSHSFIYPIQVGTELKKVKFPNMLHDNVGDNISSKNKSYCELTAQYWVWKHEEADYYGFFHYRRFFSFVDEKFNTDPIGNVVIDYLDEKAEEKIGLTEKNVQAAVAKYDIIVPEAYDIASEGSKCVEYQYAISDSQHIEDLHLAIDVIDSDYPEYSKAAHDYLKSTKGYICNMYIMKKDIFNKYCEWLFDILAKVEKRIDVSNYNECGYRVMGYLAERLFGIYIFYLKENTNYTIGELQKTLFVNTDKREKIVPIDMENKVVIATASSNEFANHTGVFIQSVLENISNATSYEILILERGLSDLNKKRLCALGEAYSNVTIRTICLNYHVYANYPKEKWNYITEKSYKLFLPEILSNYEKVVYIDSDCIVRQDIAELFHIDMQGNAIAACLDMDALGAYYNVNHIKSVDYSELNGVVDDKFVQTGVMVIDIVAAQKYYSIEKVCENLDKGKMISSDKRIINSLFNDNKLIVDMKWNCMVNESSETSFGVIRKELLWNLPKTIMEAYRNCKRDASIVHYSGYIKPWDEPDAEDSEFYWNIARKSRFYESILKKQHVINCSYTYNKNGRLLDKIRKRFKV